MTQGRNERMDPHVHFSATHAIGFLALTVALLGTAHLLAISVDNRASRAWISLGF
jgi:hypothetical protein